MAELSVVEEEEVSVATEPTGHEEHSLTGAAERVTAMRMALNPDQDLLEVYNISTEQARGSYDLEEFETTEKNKFLDEMVREHTLSVVEGKAAGVLTAEEAVTQIRNFQNLHQDYQAENGSRKIYTEVMSDDAWMREFANSYSIPETGVDLLIRKAADADQLDVVDALQDSGGMLLPDRMWKQSNLTGGSVWSAPSDMKETVRQWQSLTVEQKEKVLPSLIDRIWDANNNNMWKSTIMWGIFNDPDYESAINWEAGWDVVDITTLGLSAAIRGFSIASKIRAFTTNVGNKDLAARVLGQVQSEKATAEAVGVVAPKAQRVFTAEEEAIAAIDRQIETLLGDAGNKLPGKKAPNGRSTGERKALEVEIKDLQHKRDKILASVDTKGGTKKSRQVAREELATVEDKLTRSISLLERDDAARDAAAQISKLEAQKKVIREEGVPSSAEVLVTPTGLPAKKPLAEAMDEIFGTSSRTFANAANPFVLDKTIEVGANVDKVADKVEVLPQSLPKAPVQATDGAREVIKERIALIGADKALEAENPLETVAGAWIKTKEIEETSKGRAFASAEIIDITDTGFKVKYSLNGTDEVEEVSWSTASGSLVGDVVNTPDSVFAIMDKLFSPELQLESIAADVVNDLTFIAGQSAKIRNRLVKVWQSTDRGLSSRSKQRVNALLESGDEFVDETGNVGKVYTREELQSGAVDTYFEKAHKFTDAEVVAYNLKRAFYDEVRSIKNDTILRELQFRKMKEHHLQDGSVIIGRTRTLDEVALGIDELIKTPTKKNKYQSYKSIDDADIKNGKLVLVEMYESAYVSTKTGGKPTEVKYALIEAGKSEEKAMRSWVLSNQVGYVPRVRKPGLWYVKDVSGDNFHTLRSFDTKKQADAWSESKRLEGASEGIDVRLQTYFDGELNTIARTTQNADAWGGLFTSPRKKSLLVHGADGERPVRLNTNRATARYIDNISKAMPMDHYRTALIEKYRATVDAIARTIDPSLKSGLVNPHQWTSELNPKIVGRARAELTQYRDYLKSQFAIKSPDELLHESRLARLAKWVEGDNKASNAAKQSLLYMDRNSVQTILKNISFSNYLGWLNPRQYWLQAQMATVAMSVSPLHGIPAFFEALPMAMVGNLRHMGKSPKEVAKWLHQKKLVKNEAEAEKNIEQLWESGILDSIERTPDYDAAVSGAGGASIELIKKANYAGLMFYRQGEALGRMVAWQIARRNLKAAGIEDNVQNMVRESNRLHTNMQTPNRSVWQTNPITSLPTQFMQPIAKFNEKAWKGVYQGGKSVVTGKAGKARGVGTDQWTGSEAGRALLGQMVMYGTVGVPIATSLVNYLAQENDIDPKTFAEQNPHIYEGINEGFWGMVFNAAGIDIDASQSANLLANWSDTTVGAVIGLIRNIDERPQDIDARSLFVGPALNQIVRASDVVLSTVQGLQSIFYTPTEDKLDATRLAGLHVLDTLGKMTSTWTNVRKAQTLATTGEILSRSDKNIIGAEETSHLTDRDFLAKAFGFQLDVETALRERLEWNKTIDKHKKDAVKEIVGLARQFARGELSQSSYDALRVVILSAFRGQHDKDAIMDQVVETIWLRQSVDSKQTRKEIRNMITSGGNPTKPLSFKAGDK